MGPSEPELLHDRRNRQAKPRSASCFRKRGCVDVWEQGKM